MKKFLVMIIAVAFVFGLASLAFSETITRIAGDRITVRDDKGKEKIIKSSANRFKVGDKVKLRVSDGRTWLDPQPEPPKPEPIKPAALGHSDLQKKVRATPEAPPPPPPPPPPDKPKLK